MGSIFGGNGLSGFGGNGLSGFGGNGLSGFGSALNFENAGAAKSGVKKSRPLLSCLICTCYYSYCCCCCRTCHGRDRYCQPIKKG